MILKATLGIAPIAWTDDDMPAGAEVMGVLDKHGFGAIAKRLAGTGYQGWFVVDAEQDPAKAPPPRAYARIGHAASTEALTNAGSTIVEGRA